MQTNRSKIAVLVVAIAAAVLLFVLLKGNDSDNSTDTNAGVTQTSANGKTETVYDAPLVIKVDKDGNPVGGVQKLTVSKGEDIRFSVDSAIKDEVHLHGYDIGKEVDAGGSVYFDVPATIEGVFEAEMESRGNQILDLTVNP